MRHQVILPLAMAILGFLTILRLGPKDTEPRAPLVQKVKLGHLCRVRHQVLKLKKLSIWAGFNYPPRLDPKDTELHAPSV